MHKFQSDMLVITSYWLIVKIGAETSFEDIKHNWGVCRGGEYFPDNIKDVLFVFHLLLFQF